MDWKNFELVLLAECERAFQRWLAEHPGHTVYALAFHESYRELDGQMNLPQLAVNSLEAAQQIKSAEDNGLKWNPADWTWQNVLAIEEEPLSQLADDLNEEANRSTQNHWRKTEKRFLSVLVRIAKSIRKTFERDERTTKDFVVYVSDEAEDILRRCVPKSLFERLFAEYAPKSQVDASVLLADRMPEYLEAPWSFEEEILSLGENSIPALLEFLPSKYGYYGAVLLGKLGVRDQIVIDALRGGCGSGGGLAESSAQALFKLGDIDFLFEQTCVSATRVQAVAAIVSGLKSQSSGPLDYRFAEKLLSSGDPEVVEVVEEQLKLGSSLCEIGLSDLDEAFRGLESSHLVIRWHAVSVLGDRSLGRKAAKQVLPILAKGLADQNATVRRLTLLSLAQWKAAAKPYHDQMLRLKEDPDREVRMVATYVFE
ncbi:DUF4303 domain-containing protein [Novipirellula sp. SH528]|uniref:DUF4303 domain-containing protein n=1 Tax=Novipirellula sp. SH528 TaxID=3454466 RepID=UPI003F9F8F45